MPEVYSTSWLETAGDKIVAQLNALVTVMASGYDPKISHVYDHHNCAKLELPGVTIGIDTVAPEFEGVSSSGVTVEYPMVVTVRVHVAYVGGIPDNVKAGRLINSIVNYLKENLDLSDGYRVHSIPEIQLAQEFAESATYGAECTVVVNTYTSHDQGA